MGAVFRARDPKLGRDVAIKTIAAAVAAGDDREEIAARFEREARVAARLTHPNVVGVYDAGSEGDSLFLVMELVEGETLAHRLASGRFPSPAEAFEIAAQAADALATAHASGVIHRDIKPANLLLGRDGRVKVSDFGVAKAVGERTELTRTGMMVGSPAYMAPEQVKGMPLDGRSDLFSLGVVLFEMLCGRKPFPADTVTTLVYQILHEDPLEDPAMEASLGPGAAMFLREVLAKDRESRLADARTFAARARQLAADPRGGGGIARADTAPTMLSPAAPTGRVGSVAAPVAPSHAPPAAAALPPSSAPAEQTRQRRTIAWLAGAGALLLVTALAALALRRPPAAPQVGSERPVLHTAQPLAQPEPLPAASEPEPATTPDPAAAEPPAAAAATISPAPSAAVAPTPAPVAAPTPAPVPVATAPAEPEPVAVAPTPTAPPQPQVHVEATFETSRAAEFHVSPEEALVEIEGRLIGTADDWDDMGGGKQWVFDRPGSYLVKLSLEGYQTAWVRIVVRPDADDDVADVDTDLEKLRRR